MWHMESRDLSYKLYHFSH